MKCCDEIKAQLAALQTQLEVERQHSGHDLCEAKAKYRVLLNERIAPYSPTR